MSSVTSSAASNGFNNVTEMYYDNAQISYYFHESSLSHYWSNNNQMNTENEHRTYYNYPNFEMSGYYQISSPPTVYNSSDFTGGPMQVMQFVYVFSILL